MIRHFFIQPKNTDTLYFAYFSMNIYVMVFVRSALLTSTHKICFRGEIRKILCGYPLLSGAVLDSLLSPSLTMAQLVDHA